MKLRTGLLLVFFALVACSQPPEDHTKPGALKAGAGQRLIDLPIGHSHGGYTQIVGTPGDDPGSPYADRFPSTRGQQSPASAKVIVLDNGHWRVVLARVDAIFTTHSLTQRFIQLAREELGEDIAEQVLLNATHTHGSGCRFSRSSMVPDALAGDADPKWRHALAMGADGFSQESTDRVARALVNALRDALGTMRPAKFGWATGEAIDANLDRRAENDAIDGGKNKDSRVTVLRVDDAETDKPIAVAFHYAMHGTVYDMDNRLLSVDAPGHSEFKVEELFDEPVVAMFVQGSAGDVSPQRNGNSGSQAMQYAGWALAREVRSTWESIELQRELSLDSIQRWVPLGREVLGYAEGEFHEDGALFCGAKEPSPDAVSCLGVGMPDEGSYATWLAAARIGGLALVTLPGEPMTAVGQALEAKALEGTGFERVVVLGYAQDHQGYLLLDQDWLSGGYEPTISFWGWKMTGYLVDQSAKLVHAMAKNADREGPKVPRMPPLDPEPYEPVVTASSSTDAAIAVEPPAEVERLSSIDFSFVAGDPGLGQPAVSLQRQNGDAWEPVLKNGWIPVASHHGYEIPLTFQPTPTYREAPDATEREHLWGAHYEPPHDLPAGAYRFHIKARIKRGGEVRDAEVTTRAFELVPSRSLQLDGQLTTRGDKLVFDGTLLYPQKRASYSTASGNGGWQLDGFRLVDPRFAAPFAPATPKAIAVSALLVAGPTEEPITLSFIERPITTIVPRYTPGEGSGLYAEVPLAGPGTYQVAIPGGLLEDQWGNTHDEPFAVELVVN